MPIHKFNYGPHCSIELQYSGTLPVWRLKVNGVYITLGNKRVVLQIVRYFRRAFNSSCSVCRRNQAIHTDYERRMCLAVMNMDTASDWINKRSK